MRRALGTLSLLASLMAGAVDLPPVPTPPELKKLYSDLDSELYGPRPTAYRKLLEFGPPVLAPLAALEKNRPSSEVRKALAQLEKDFHAPIVKPWPEIRDALVAEMKTGECGKQITGFVKNVAHAVKVPDAKAILKLQTELGVLWNRMTEIYEVQEGGGGTPELSAEMAALEKQQNAAEQNLLALLSPALQHYGYSHEAKREGAETFHLWARASEKWRVEIPHSAEEPFRVTPYQPVLGVKFCALTRREIPERVTNRWGVDVALVAPSGGKAKGQAEVEFSPAMRFTFRDPGRTSLGAAYLKQAATATKSENDEIDWDFIHRALFPESVDRALSQVSPTQKTISIPLD